MSKSVDELKEELLKLKKEKAELEQHRKVMGQVAGRQGTEELKKYNPFSPEEMEKIRIEFNRKYPDHVMKTDSNWAVTDEKLSETIKNRISRALNTAEALMNTLENVTKFEETFETGKPVYYRNQVGLLNKFYIYDEYSMDKLMLEDNRYARNGDIIATVVFAGNDSRLNSRTVLARDLLPYNESTRLLYERDKIK